MACGHLAEVTAADTEMPGGGTACAVGKDHGPSVDTEHGTSGRVLQNTVLPALGAIGRSVCGYTEACVSGRSAAHVSTDAVGCAPALQEKEDPAHARFQYHLRPDQRQGEELTAGKH